MPEVWKERDGRQLRSLPEYAELQTEGPGKRTGLCRALFPVKQNVQPMRACEGRTAPQRADISLRMRELYGPGCECSSEYPGGRAQDPDVSVKRKTARFRAVKNRGTRGDSLLMLSPSGLSNRKPPLLSDSESGGSMSLICLFFYLMLIFREQHFHLTLHRVSSLYNANLHKWDLHIECSRC